MSSTPSRAFAVACSAAAFALSMKPIGAPFLFAEDAAQQPAALAGAATGGLHDAARGARERQRLQRDVARAGHVDQEEAFAAAHHLLQPTLSLDLVAHGRLDHDHAAGVDDERLAVG